MKWTVEDNEAKMDDKALHPDQTTGEDHDRQGATVQAVGGTIAAVVH